jgi:hypothetical protein
MQGHVRDLAIVRMKNRSLKLGHNFHSLFSLSTRILCVVHTYPQYYTCTVNIHSKCLYHRVIMSQQHMLCWCDSHQRPHEKIFIYILGAF